MTKLTRFHAVDTSQKSGDFEATKRKTLTKSRPLWVRLGVWLLLALVLSIMLLLQPFGVWSMDRPVIREPILRHDVSVIESDEPVVWTPTIAECPPLVEFYAREEIVAVRFDPISRITQVFAGHYNDNCIYRFDIDTAFNYAKITLPLEYATASLAEDLDQDGEFELVVEYGDGYNGFLEILSAPDWTLRQSFVFPGMNVMMSPIAINIDDDPYLEVFATPHFFGAPGWAIIIKYNSTEDTFEIIAEVPANGISGRSAAGDFDNDGRMEFISGFEYTGFGLFEWQDTALVYIGLLDVPFGGYSLTACRPKPGGVLHALFARASGESGFLYHLLAPIGDNTFRLVDTFFESNGWHGVGHCFGLDVDCDGLDELAMGFFPPYKVLHWDELLGGFVEGCIWDRRTYGGLYRWHKVDVDQDGVPEWGVVNGGGTFRVFPGPGCVSCDSVGHCDPPEPECYCACRADPCCDGVVDVLDVVTLVDIVYRDASPQPDPGPLCPTMRTDVDCSGSTDALDVVRIVKVAFRGGSSSEEFCEPCAL